MSNSSSTLRVSIFITFISASILSACGSTPVRHDFGVDSVDVSVIPSGDVVRVRKATSDPYQGELLPVGAPARMKTFSDLAVSQMNEYCGKKNKKSRPASDPAWFATTWGNRVDNFAKRPDPNEISFPQMLEWRFSCE